jgi:hydrogenase-1 operon protein HyaF
MKDIPISVRMIGPGSQPAEDDELHYLPMPHEMNTFRMPRVPGSADVDALGTARDILATLLRSMERWDVAARPFGPQLVLAAIPAAALEIVDQMLGEGEVSIQVSGTRVFRIQESVFTGVWRVCEFDAEDRRIGDWIEAAVLPHVTLEATRVAASPTLPPVAVPAGAMNSPALLHEISAQVNGRKDGARAHVINLTLFPMTPDDYVLLDRALPAGPVVMMSRGFGNCRIASTGTRDVWRVQYYNSANTLILSTIEIVDVPEVAKAAVEDLEDSRVRLAELVDWMSESCAEQA